MLPGWSDCDFLSWMHANSSSVAEATLPVMTQSPNLSGGQGGGAAGLSVGELPFPIAPPVKSLVISTV